MIGEKSLIEAILKKWDAVFKPNKAIVGFDGYVDKIQHPVQYQSKAGNQYFPTLTSFGERIQKAARQSAQIELFTQVKKIGGNGPIMAHALGTLGIQNTCIGTLGHPEIDPVFSSIHKNSKLISVGPAAETNALEFNDGKLILSELSTFSNLDWGKVVDLIGLDHLVNEYQQVNLLALVDWCNLPNATSIWTGFLNDIVSKNKQDDLQFFFDLADPSKKSLEEIKEVLALIKSYCAYGKVTLGLNENETHLLYRLLAEKDSVLELKERGAFIMNYLDIDRLLVHPIDSCIVYERENHYHLSGQLIEQPQVSTGGGDNFNAGFCFGLLNDFSVEESMILAMATSGAYVQNGNSPDQNSLVKYLSDWESEI